MMRNLAVSFLAISRILGGDPPSAVLASVGGRDLYLSVFRDRDPRALKSDALRNVLLRQDPRSWRS